MFLELLNPLWKVLFAETMGWSSFFKVGERECENRKATSSLETIKDILNFVKDNS
jgi:hypothetical protein